MKPTLFDTDTLSFFLRNENKNEKKVTQKINEYLKEHEKFTISIITYYELLNGLYFGDSEERTTEIELLLNNHTILPLSKKAAQKAAQIYTKLRSEGNSIAHNDILIAATAIVENLVLITNNNKHFDRIEELKTENWTK
ncbi:putative nucleic acid-binding protein, contains PIN domain [Bernardetia litoralis DSM 6794]|uniref:Putative nucleic acid-binding protein, contains PIN domain n=1 Tax=Bernardetia litoralis (strain ATCC 23117 / DSM 6794 / NBRC 15988 / NCIMB 1366 / Fx l1 / Sio-4) TaxID=880071 RepID=I4ALJ9_BERLS|nr:type II toxin-antitoxin system VapC family toxin [Bernardetia litoralis]AFM04834.1 putative nucleic acid-binding protein, contains PIN domain [Bernardetia litoralis DSM 6794]